MSTLDVIRIGLHVLAASVWVGGQIVLAGLVPSLREIGPDAPGIVARRFNVIAWSAYVLILFTGLWNLLEVGNVPHPLFEIKFMFFVLAGLGAVLHIRANGNTALLAIGGALATLSGVIAMFLGVAL